MWSKLIGVYAALLQSCKHMDVAFVWLIDQVQEQHPGGDERGEVTSVSEAENCMINAS